MFKISKYFFYTLGIVIFLSRTFACSGSGSGCVSMELIPEGYRAQEYNNPVLKKATQIRLTEHSFTFLKENLGAIIKTIMPDMYGGQDDDGNPKIKFCMPPSYGVKSGIEFGVASTCDHNSCDVCGEASGSDGTWCENTSYCSSGINGFDIEITLKNIIIEPQDQDSTEADLIHTSVELEITDHSLSGWDRGIPFWTNGIWWSDDDDENTRCKLEIDNTPVILNIDFTIPNSNLEEITFDVDVDYTLEKDNIDPECDGAIDSVMGLVKGEVIDQIKPVINGMIAEFKDTLMCTSCVPNNPDTLADGYHCPINAPAGSTCNSGACTADSCDDGFECGTNGLCGKHTSCTDSSECEGNICDNGVCVVMPLCMEVDSGADKHCWKQRLGMDGRIDTKAIIGKFLNSEGESWINFYINMAEYAKSQSGGISIGLFGGTNSDYSPCVPESPNHYDQQIPELEIFNSNELDGDPYHLGIGISEYFLNQSFDSIYKSGAFCVDIDTNTMAMLSSETIALADIASIYKLTETNSNTLLSMRPKTPPVIEIGEGNVNEDGNPIFGEALINMAIDNFNIDFYLFSENRYIRIFTAVIDMKFAINLIVDNHNNLIPTLAPLKLGDNEAIRNIKILNNEILLENKDDLKKSLEIILGTTLEKIHLEFGSFPLPNFMGFSLNNIKLKKISQGNDVTSDFLGIFAQIGIGGAVRRPNIDELSVSNIVLPKLKDLKRGKTVALELNINLDDNTNIESQYRIDNSFWRPFKNGTTLKIDDPILRVQGKHTIYVRSRYKNSFKSLSEIKSYTIVTDTISPKVKLKRIKDNIIIEAKDNYSRPIALKYSVNIDNKGWIDTKDLVIPINNRKELFIQVKVKDGQGNENMISKRFNFNNRRIVRNTQESSGCSYNNDSNSGFLFMLFALSFILFRKRKLILLSLISVLITFSSCDSPEKNKCSKTTDCKSGQVCESGKCVAPTCTDDSTEYVCDECYIQGRCTDEAGDNPCKIGCECFPGGKCIAIEGYCDTENPCEDDSMECKDKTCVPKRCTDDESCKDKECTIDEHAYPYCDIDTGACRCAVPCGGSCGDGKFCCKAKDSTNWDQCLVNPEACSDYNCEPGYEINVVNAGSIDETVTCDLVNVECSCKELPHLKLGTIGKYNNTLVWKNKLIIVGYSSEYQDLVLGLYDEGVETTDKEHIKWTFLDGILNNDETEAEITHGPTGPRGGISQKGNHVGEYASAVIDSNDKIHVSYYDRTNKSLKYAIITENTTDENIAWDIKSITLDSDGDVGFYTNITLGSNNIPVITYMSKEFSKNDSFYSALKIAIANSDNPIEPSNWEIQILEEVNKELPCNRSCGDGEVCLFNPVEVERCNSRTENKIFSNNSLISIPDNSSTGVLSEILIPIGVKAIEFKLNLDITHAFIGDLKITLIAPSGREVVITNSGNNASQSLILNNKYLYQFKNKNVSGLWKLSIIDTRNGDTGSLNSWSLVAKTRRDSSLYCGARCYPETNDCQCGQFSGSVCTNGTCLNTAKESEAHYYERGVGVFAKSKRFSDDNLLSILYIDTLEKTLKNIYYNIATKTIIDSVILETGGIFESNLSIIDDVNYITFKDNMKNLRYLKYTPQTNIASSTIIDDGIRELDTGYELHKVGSDSTINKIGDSQNLELHYMDTTTHKILRKTFDGLSWSDFEVFKDSFENNSYVASFGFYLNVLYLSGQKVVTTFLYKLKEDDASESKIPGKIRVLK